MYVPDKHQPPDKKTLLECLHHYPLATITRLNGNSLEADHLPLILNQEGTKLQGHCSKDNPLSDTNDDTEALVIFHGPNHYISPSWYASKESDNNVVPTWNYVTVHITGKLSVINDPHWLLNHLAQLTAKGESGVGASWKMTDASEEYIQRLASHIVGLEITMESIIGRWKTTIVKPEINVIPVTRQLDRLAVGGASEMAHLIRKRYP